MKVMRAELYGCFQEPLPPYNGKLYCRSFTSSDKSVFSRLVDRFLVMYVYVRMRKASVPQHSPFLLLE
jgi:hypothetical protein